MSDPNGIPDTPFHRLVEALSTASNAWASWKTAKFEFDDLHPLDGQFRAADLGSILSGARDRYDEALTSLEQAFDDCVPNDDCSG